MFKREENSTFRIILHKCGNLRGDPGKNAVEIRINFQDIPPQKRSQVEEAANKFLNLAEEILSED